MQRAAAAGLTTIAITDHDTVGGLREAVAAGAELGVRVVPGIEITAVENQRDVHVLGYFLDPDSTVLTTFLQAQRSDRIRRVRESASRLSELGFRIEIEPLLAAERVHHERVR